jgi:o-succinylbenzoate synthase
MLRRFPRGVTPRPLRGAVARDRRLGNPVRERESRQRGIAAGNARRRRGVSGTIEVLPYALPLAQEYRWAKGVQRERRGLLVRVEAWGAEGWGESAPPIHLETDGAALAAEAREHLADLPVDADDFLARLDARGVPARLRCGIAAAWMAARAAAAGVPLANEIAPGRQAAHEVPVNGLVTEKTPEEAAARAAALVAEGYRTLKVKCWEDRQADLSRVAAIRAAAPAAKLRLDANESWDPSWALEHLRALWRHDIEYVEQPIPSSRPLAEMAAFRRLSPIRVALDESATDAASLARILALKAADVVILKTQRAGGPDKAGAMIKAAAEAGVQVTVTVSLESAIGTAVALHVAATLPAPLPDCGIPMGRFLAADLGPMPPVEPGAVMRLPRSGGLGLAPDPTALAALRAG